MIRGAFILFCSVAIPLLGIAGELGEKNKIFAYAYFSVMFNYRDPDILNGVLAEDFKHTDAAGNVTIGLEAHKQVLAELQERFPGIQAKIVETIATDEKVMTVVNFTADIPPDFQAELGATTITFRELFVWRNENGQIVEGRTLLGNRWITGL